MTKKIIIGMTLCCLIVLGQLSVKATDDNLKQSKFVKQSPSTLAINRKDKIIKGNTKSLLGIKKLSLQEPMVASDTSGGEETAKISKREKISEEDTSEETTSQESKPEETSEAETVKATSQESKPEEEASEAETDKATNQESKPEEETSEAETDKATNQESKPEEEASEAETEEATNQESKPEEEASEAETEEATNQESKPEEEASEAETDKATNQESKPEEEASEAETDEEKSQKGMSGVDQNLMDDNITEDEKSKISYSVSNDGLTMNVQLKRRPKCISMQLVIVPRLLNEYRNVKTLVIDGEFSRDDLAMGSGNQLSLTNVETIVLQHSNIIPYQFYFATSGRDNKLKTLKLDSSVKSSHENSLIFSGRSSLSNLEKVEAPGLAIVHNGTFDGFKGTELVLDALEGAKYADGLYNNFYDFPNAKRLILPKLKELNGYKLFSNMPKMEEIDLRSLTDLSVSRGSNIFDTKELAQPMRINLSSLLQLPEVDFGNIDAAAPIYVLANKNLTIHDDAKLNNAFFYSAVNPQKNYIIPKDETIKISAFGEKEVYKFDSAKFLMNWYLDDKLWKITDTANVWVANKSISKGKHILKPVITFRPTKNSDYVEDKKNVPLKPITISPEEEPIVTTQKVTAKLGQSFQPKDFIKEVKVGDDVIPMAELDIKAEQEQLPKKLLRNNHFMYATEKNKGITVPLTVGYRKPETGIHFEVNAEATLDVNYGATIGMQTIAPAVGFNKTDMGSLTLVKESNGLSLRPVYGEKAATEYPYAINDANHVAIEAYVGLYQGVNNLVDVSAKQDREGEILQDNQYLQQYPGGTTLDQMIELGEKQFGNVTINPGDVVAQSVHKHGKQYNWETKITAVDKFLYGEQSYMGGDNLKFSRFNTDLFEAGVQNGQPTFSHLTLNHFENPHGPKPLKESKDIEPVPIKTFSDLNDEKVLSYLGLNRDIKKFNGYANISKEVKEAIDLDKGGIQTIPVQVFEKLSNTGYARYEYDLKIDVKKPITVKYVYTDSNKTLLPKSESGLANVTKKYTIKDANQDGTLKIDPTNLSKKRFDFKGSFNGDNLISNKEEAINIPFESNNQTIYLKYKGQSWVDSLKNDFSFHGKMLAEKQLLINQGDKPVQLTVKSTDLHPEWSLRAKIDNFKEPNSHQTITQDNLALRIDKKILTQDGVIVHRTPVDNQLQEITLTFGDRDTPTTLNNKKADVAVGKNSYRWIKPTKDYTATITWEVNDSNQSFQEYQTALPLKVGAKDDR
ncbi:hypothetical protein [Vagococcus intermedius]|uniref:WxL domain-containing protein n=1 Tax=Vagococcus intermedius TaxID=2991418 RepID=A0AAF0CUB3_9ENTE|nr:hypothetical protein [Vagococcus intermedius]WEG73089.1 hypothetical protein OL234_08985 [Vagococcus intermedius]WEG75173.1 hypothetical protein OL235_08980 [Vagococcus intermedius]